MVSGDGVDAVRGRTIELGPAEEGYENRNPYG